MEEKKPIIVVIDRNEPGRFYIVKLVTEYCKCETRYEVANFATHEEAWEFISSDSERVKMIFSDLGECRHLDTIEHLKKIEKTYPEISLFLITGAVSSVIEEVKTQVSIKFSFGKPPRIQDLKREIKKELGN